MILLPYLKVWYDSRSQISSMLFFKEVYHSFNFLFMIYFELFFMCGTKFELRITALYMDISLFQQHLLKMPTLHPKSCLCNILKHQLIMLGLFVDYSESFVSKSFLSSYNNVMITVALCWVYVSNSVSFKFILLFSELYKFEYCIIYVLEWACLILLIASCLDVDLNCIEPIHHFMDNLQQVFQSMKMVHIPIYLGIIWFLLLASLLFSSTQFLHKFCIYMLCNCVSAV